MKAGVVYHELGGFAPPTILYIYFVLCTKLYVVVCTGTKTCIPRLWASPLYALISNQSGRRGKRDEKERKNVFPKTRAEITLESIFLFLYSNPWLIVWA
jgi:hypothetical protein